MYAVASPYTPPVEPASEADHESLTGTNTIALAVAMISRRVPGESCRSRSSAAGSVMWPSLEIVVVDMVHKDAKRARQIVE